MIVHSEHKYIFDFDGVLCNSIEECMIVSYNGYHQTQLDLNNKISNSMRKYFFKYRHLVRPAGEYYLIWESFYNNKNFMDLSFEKMKMELVDEDGN